MKQIAVLVFTLATLCMMLCGVASGASSGDFQRWWPWIYKYVKAAKTNVVVTGIGVVSSQDEHNVWINVNVTVLNSNLLFSQLGDVMFPTNLANDGLAVVYDHGLNKFIPEGFVPDSYLLLESGDFLLLETGDKMVLE